MMRAWSSALFVVLLTGGCQCFVPVDDDAGLGLDAGGVDAGAVDIDGGVADAGGVSDAGLVDAGDGGSGRPDCATVRCSPWSICVEDGGAVCVPTVTALRWVVPIFDAAVPLDTIRLAVALEVTGDAEVSIPVSTSGAGQSSTLAIRSDAGLAVGQLSFTTLDAGRLLLFAGWSGGPEAVTAVNVLPRRAIEIVGPNPPSHGVNSSGFEPNDPEGSAWRRDDVVPFRSWPGAQVVARHDHPDASEALIDAGPSCDGGCAKVPLQDVEFNAFRGEVELRAVSDAGWEARGERLSVTRWRWRRVVAGVPNPIAVQTPVMSDPGAPWSTAIVVGTKDTPSTGRLANLDEEGLPIPSSLSQGWSAAVTAPVDGCSYVVAGFDGDAGFLWSPRGTIANIVGERFVLVGGGTDRSVAVTDRATVVTGNTWNSRYLFGTCGFDGGTPTNLLAANLGTVVAASSGELCAIAAPAYPWEEDAGVTRMLSARVFPFAGGGFEWPTVVTTDGRLTEVRTFASGTQVLPFLDAGAVDTLVMGVDWYLFTSKPEVVRASLVALTPPQASFARTSALRSRVMSPPVFRPTTEPSQGGREGLLYIVGQDRRLSVIATVNLKEAWSWAPDAGLSLSAPMGFAPSVGRLGSLLLPVHDSVLSIIADGDWYSGNLGWTQSGGDPQNCGTEAGRGGF